MSATPEASNASTSSSIVQAILTGTCTIETTPQLSELLNGRAKQTSSTPTSSTARPATAKGHARAKSTATAPSRPAARPTDATKRAHTSRAKSVDLRQPASLTETALDGHAKECLATEVVNAVLKALTLAVKSQRSTVGPLTETSDNAKGAPIVRVKRASKDATTATLLQTAECGKVAFGYLRLKTAGGDAPWSLVGGMLAFIGRLIVLDLTSVASSELKPVKSFLCECLSKDGSTKLNPNGASRRAGGGNTTRSNEVSDIASMLDFRTLDISDQALPHIIEFQSHALALCARSGCRSSEGVQKLLHKTEPTSPHSLLLRKHELDANFERSLRQMEAFAQSILGLARALANSSRAEDGAQVISPQSILQLRLVALGMRMDWMQRAGHEADLDKEIFGLLASWIEIYIKQDRMSADVQLSFLKHALRSVEKDAEGLKKSKAFKTASQCPGHVKIRLRLSRLAEKAGRNSESREWTQPSSHTSHGAHEVQAVECTLLLRNAAIALNSVTDDPKSFGEAESAVNACAGMLSGQVNGTQAELVSLFAELNTLRKVSMIKLRPATDTTQSDDSPQSSDKLGTLCRTALFALVPFVIRIVWTCSNNNASGNALTDSVMGDLVKLSQACIKSVLNAIDKSPVSTVDLAGARTAVQQCLELAASLDLEKVSSSDNYSVGSVRVLASNMFSSLYQRIQKKTPGFHGDAVDALHFSCQLLEAAGPQERQEGQLQTKLQHLGRLLENRGAVKDALTAYTKSLRIAVDDGVLSKLSERADRDRLQEIIHDTPQAVSFGKSLETAMRLAAKLVDSTWAEQLSTDLKFSDEAYGLWMEWQLVIINSWPRSEKQSGYRTSIVKRLVNGLLHVYDPALYPVRRARSIAQALRLAAQDPALMDAAAKMISSGGFSNADFGKDGDLSRYLDTWMLIVRTLLAFNSPSRTVGDLQAVLRSWQKTSQLRNQSDTGEAEDEEALMATLVPVATYFEGQAMHSDQLSVSLLILHRTPKGRSNVYRLNLARSLHQLGHNDCATEVLARVEKPAEEKPLPSTAILYHLLRLDIAISTGQLDNSPESVLAVGNFLDSFANTNLEDGNRRLDFEKTLLRARCYHVYSAVVREQGDLYQSLRCSRNSVRWFQRLWRSVDPSKSRGASASAMREEESDIEGLVADVSNMTIKDSTPTDALGLLYWKILPQYVEALLRLSAIFEIYGLVQDALYYATQALQVSEAAQASGLIAKALTLKGSIECKSNDLEQSSLSLSRAGKVYEGLGPSRDKFALQCVLADLHGALEEPEDQEHDLRCAETILQDIDAAASPALTDVNDVLQSIPLSSTSPDGKNPGSRQKVIKARKASPTAAKAVSRADLRASDKVSLNHLDLQRRRLQHRLSTGDLEGVDLPAYGELVCSRASKLPFVQAQVSLLLKQGLEVLSQDVVHASLADSSLAIPSCASYDGQERASSPIKKGCKTIVGIKYGLSLQLSDAIRLINSAFKHDNGSASPHTTQQMLCDWVNASMILSYGRSEHLDRNSVGPALIAHVIDYAALLAAERGLASTALQYVDTSLSSSTQAKEMRCVSAFDDIECSFSDILPSSWNVISMSLSNDQTHLQIVRYLHRQEPFVLRLPLIRQSDHELDDEEDNRFGFLDAKHELLDIIEQSDKIVHKARDSPDELAEKGAKTTWWAEREQLDQRLGDLMQNIENMWLGGLKGILSSSFRDGECMKKLQSDVERILDDHLPSRLQQKRRKHANKVMLHSSVYELFAGLAEVQNEASNELPEAIEDLLYFVVDIAQFHGEHNAYDEIDFDAMTVKTMDAMHAYRDSQQQSPGLEATERSRHTILVLDKQLQAFPWESLTCLNSRSISRVCSTLEIKDRIAAMRTQSDPADTQDGITLSPVNGTYILNPSSDLSRTQTRLEPALQTLTSWTTITNHKPTEAEFSTALSPTTLQLSLAPTTVPSQPKISLNTSLLLYFGHGPGTQYIRHRSIKKLRHAPTSCATALLFGCSSAALTVPGQFTEYGTPKSYLHAGAPAVLGSLWDVTDADCDAFARGVLCRWGLCSIDSFPDDEGTGKKGRRKVVKGMRAEEAKARIREDLAGWDGRRVCLAEAVARSRGDCYLRWLNGAAMVVYGVPVFLE